jgi:nucleoside-diphosphate-sugar epimerase
MTKKSRILITGANGQIGSVLVPTLRKIYGNENVLPTDIRKVGEVAPPFEFLDILNTVRFREILGDYEITEVYHMAALLSASGEYNPLKTWNINFNAFLDLLEFTREGLIDKLFFPSTIAIFGATTPKINTPQDVPLLPETIYGISKTSGELMANYYNKKYGVDVRSLRYPGIISHQSVPEGGTTDYAVEIFHSAVKGEDYTCFLAPNTRLPMMYINDAINATLQIMQANSKELKVRYSYNLAAMSFTPHEIYKEILRHYPDFKIHYKPDFRQEIAKSWTESIDDSSARNEWNWKHEFDLPLMVDDMIKNLKIKYNKH